MSQHSPLPWKYDGDGYLLHAGGSIVADAFSGLPVDAPEPDVRAAVSANAALIVHRVNTFEALVEALRGVLAVCEDHLLEIENPALFDAAKSALRLAESPDV